MSLINQVLQDLDRRQVGAASPLAPIGVAAARHAPQGPRWLIAVAIAAAGATLALALTFSGAFAGVAVRVAAPVAVRPAAATAATTAATTAMPPVPGVAAATIAAPASQNETALSPARTAANVTTAAAANVGAAAAVVAVALPAPTAAAEATTQPSPAPAPNPVTQPSKPAAPAAAPIEDRRADASAPERVAIATLPAQLDKRAPPASARERAEAAYRRGLAAHRDGHDDSAEEAFALALHEDARHAGARQALAVLLAGRQRSDAAETLLSEGLALDAHQAMLARTLARIKAARGDVAGAIAVLDGQDGAAAQALLATLLQNAGRHREAIEHYALALQLAPGNGAWWAGLSVSLAAVGRHETAREALLRARASESIDADLLAWIEQRLRTGMHAATATATN